MGQIVEKTTKGDIYVKITQGEMIECSAQDYNAYVRHHLHAIAGEAIDHKQNIHARIALQEVKRLDKKFNYTLLEEEVEEGSA